MNEYIDQLEAQIAAYSGPYQDQLRWLPRLHRFFIGLYDDTRLHRQARMLCNAALAYGLLPFDVVPESSMGAYGFIDDLYLAAEVLQNLQQDAALGELLDDLPALGHAIVDGGESKLARIGSTVDGGAKVIAIARRYIVVEEEGGKRSYIRLWSKKKPKQGPRIASLRSGAHSKPFGGFRRPAGGAARNNRTNWAEGITKVGPDEYEIKRSLLDEQLQDLGKLGTQARIIPNYRNGRYEGFKLVGVRPNSLYRAIGIRSGDVIKRVNGVAIDNPSKAIELFEQFRTASEISLDIERRGKVKTFTYKIR